eukprot:g300.t1
MYKACRCIRHTHIKAIYAAQNDWKSRPICIQKGIQISFPGELRITCNLKKKGLHEENSKDSLRLRTASAAFALILLHDDKICACINFEFDQVQSNVCISTSCKSLCKDHGEGTKGCTGSLHINMWRDERQGHKFWRDPDVMQGSKADTH